MSSEESPKKAINIYADAMRKWEKNRDSASWGRVPLRPLIDFVCEEFDQALDEARAPGVPDSLMQRLLNKVNAVTAYHRGGAKIPKKNLDELCNRQVEVEEELRKSPPVPQVPSEDSHDK